MQTEIEVKFCQVDIDDMRDRLKKAGATCEQRSDHKASTGGGTKEVQVEVSDFEKAIEILRLSDLPPITYQESRRETWNLGETEIVIDEWPWIKPYIEIEGPSEQAVKAVAAKLELDWRDVLIAQIDFVYMLQYDFAPGVRGLQEIPGVRFELPLHPQLQPKKVSQW